MHNLPSEPRVPPRGNRSCVWKRAKDWRLACSEAAPPGFNRVVAKAHRRSTGTRTWRKGAGAIGRALGRLQRIDGGRDARSRRALASEWVGRWCSTARHVVVGRQSSRGAVQRRSQRASSAGSCTRASGASLALVDATAIAVAQARPRLVHFPALRALSSARRASLHPLLMQFAAFGARARRQLHASQLCASGAG